MWSGASRSTRLLEVLERLVLAVRDVDGVCAEYVQLQDVAGEYCNNNLNGKLQFYQLFLNTKIERA